MAEQQDNYGPDYRASMAGARLQWDKLSPTMQDALALAPFISGGRRLRSTVSTAFALARRGLCTRMLGVAHLDRYAPLTPMGLLVREAGLAARAEVAR